MVEHDRTSAPRTLSELQRRFLYLEPQRLAAGCPLCFSDPRAGAEVAQRLRGRVGRQLAEVPVGLQCKSYPPACAECILHL
jgi:hypothetical protein